MSDLNLNPLVTTRDARARAGERRYAFSSVAVTSTTAAAAQLVATNDAASATVVAGLTVGNDVAGAAVESFSLCVVNEGDTPSTANAVLVGITVPIGEVLTLNSALFLNPSQSLYAYASTTGKLRISGWLTSYL